MGTRKTEKHNRTTIFSPLFERKWGVLGTFCIVLLLLFLAIYLVNPEPILKKIDALAGVSASPAPAPDALEVYVLDVGQGDCILLRTPGGKAMLVDAGEAIYAARIKRFWMGSASRGWMRLWPPIPIPTTSAAWRNLSAPTKSARSIFRIHPIPRNPISTCWKRWSGLMCGPKLFTPRER